MQTNPGRSSRRRVGAAAIEFAFTLPMMLLIVVGMVEFGRAMMVEQMLTNAAREGARLAVLPASAEGEVTAKVTEYLATGNIVSNRLQVVVTPSSLSGARTGTPVSVDVSVPYEAVAWLPTPWFLGNTTLSAQCVMRHE